MRLPFEKRNSIRILLVFVLFSACSKSDFSASSKNEDAKKKTPTPTPIPTTNPVTPVTPNVTPTPPPADSVLNSDGSLTLNVPLAKIELTVVVDHVTDFVVSDRELYAIHHQLAIPQIASFKLFGANGQQIDQKGWMMGWGNCPTYPTYDSNCPSAKVLLNAGHVLKKFVTKISGRGNLWKFADTPFTVRITDCGASDCGAYGATGRTWSSTDTYVWTME